MTKQPHKSSRTIDSGNAKYGKSKRPVTYRSCNPPNANTENDNVITWKRVYCSAGSNPIVNFDLKISKLAKEETNLKLNQKGYNSRISKNTSNKKTKLT